MRDKTNFLIGFLFFMNSISETYTAEINVIDADVDLGSTNATTWVLLMESDLKSVYAVLFSCTVFNYL